MCPITPLPRAALAGVLCALLSAGAPGAFAQDTEAMLRPVNADEPLPADPGMVEGRLDNGLRYLVLEHASPGDGVHLNLRVDVGSLDELDSERGLARFAQEYSMGWAQGASLERLRARGLHAGEDLWGRVRYDQTLFGLALPGAGAGVLGDGLGVLRSIVGGGLVDGQSVEGVRRTILTSLRAADDGAARARAQWLADLGGDSQLGTRPPEGTQDSIGLVSPEGLAVFLKRWYGAQNMTLIVVGAVDGDETARLISEMFSTLDPSPTPERQRRGIAAPGARRAAVGSDPELEQTRVALIRIAPVREPVRTVGGLRRFVLERAAMEAMEVRLRSAMSDGRITSDRPRVYSTDLFRLMHYTHIGLSVEGGDWAVALEEMCREVARVREHGFTNGEVEEARHRLLAQLEGLVQGRASLPSSELIRWVSYSDAQGHAWVDPGRELALSRRFLVEADSGLLGKVFRVLAPAGEEVLLVSAPAGEGAPARDTIMSIGSAALDSPTSPTPEAPGLGRLFDRVPEAGEIVEISAHPSSGVWSAQLSNGVRVHHNRVGYGGGRVVVSLTLDLGPPADTRQRALSACAANAWAEPALGGLDSASVRRVMAEARTQLRSWVEQDMLRLEIETTPEHLTTAMELASRMLTDPVIEAPAFERWTRAQRASARERARDPRALIDAAMDAPPSPGGGEEEPSSGGAESVTIDDARAWLRERIRSAPIEAAIAGDVSRTEAFELCERYLGSLTPRPAQLSEPPLRDDPATGISLELTADTVTPVAAVLVGFRSCDASDVRRAHLLSIASRVLERRLSRVLRDERGIGVRIRAEMSPGRAGSGQGVFAVRVTTSPEHADEVARLIESEITRLGERGPSEDEFRSVTRRIERAYLEAITTPAFWGSRLSDLHRSGRSLDDVIGVIDRQNAFTPEDVREAIELERESRPGIRVIARPTSD